MSKTNCFFSLLLCNLAIGANFDEPKEIEVRFSAYPEDTLSLKGIGSRRQIVVTGKYHDGDERDLTRKVRMERDLLESSRSRRTGGSNLCPTGKAP